MARLWTAGAELQTVTAGVEFTSIDSNAPAVETTTKRSGNAAWRISNASAVEGLRQNHSSSQGTFYFQFYLRIVAMPTNTRYIAGAQQTLSKVVIRLTSGGLLQLWNAEDSAQVGSNSSALSTGTWYRIAMMYNTTTLASTAVEARAYADTPGAAAFWNPSGTIDLAATPTRFGCFIDAADATLDYIVDDLAINDTSGSFQNSWPGEEKVIVLRPDGNGDNSQWAGSDGNSTDNYLLVNEVPPSSAQYVESNTNNQIDDYTLEATPAAMGSGDTINVVHVGAYAAVSDITSADPDIVLRIKAAPSGTVEESAALDVNSATFQGPAPLPANSNYQLTLYDLPGASTTVWTKADLDAAQAGVREAASDTHFARVAALWVMVGFTPSSGTQYTQSASGAMTPAGAVLKQTNKPVAGAITPAGTITKSSTKTFTGAITPGGAILKAISKAFAGTLTSSGTSAKGVNKSFTGTLTSAGTDAKQTARTAAGTLTSAGSTTRSAAKSLTGALSSSGAIGRQTNKVVAGVLATSGTIARAISKFVSGALSSVGALIATLTGSVTEVKGSVSIGDTSIYAASASDQAVYSSTIGDTTEYGASVGDT